MSGENLDTADDIGHEGVALKDDAQWVFSAQNVGFLPLVWTLFAGHWIRRRRLRLAKPIQKPLQLRKRILRAASDVQFVTG